MIKVKNISKKFGNEEVLKDVSINIEKGKIYGIVGHNGSGKSVLFKTIVGLVLANSGEVYVDGEKIGKDNFPKDIGVILDCTGFLPMYSAFKNLKMIAEIKGIADDNRIKEVIELVGLDPNSKKRVGKFSVGMKQRLAFAQAIMEKPSLLILDEPMNGLDSDGVELMRGLIKKMNEEDGVTVVMASHVREDIDILCDEVYKMNRGILTIEEKKKVC